MGHGPNTLRDHETLAGTDLKDGGVTERTSLFATVADHARNAADAGRSAGSVAHPSVSWPGWTVRDLLHHLGSMAWRYAHD